MRYSHLERTRISSIFICRCPTQYRGRTMPHHSKAIKAIAHDNIAVSKANIAVLVFTFGNIHCFVEMKNCLRQTAMNILAALIKMLHSVSSTTAANDTNSRVRITLNVASSGGFKQHWLIFQISSDYDFCQ